VKSMAVRRTAKTIYLLLVAILLSLIPVVARPAAAAACPNPSFGFSRSTGPVGADIVMTGFGWVPGATVSITTVSAENAHFMATSDTPLVSQQGSWTSDFIVGESTPLGSYTFRVVQEAGTCSLAVHNVFTVTA